MPEPVSSHRPTGDVHGLEVSLQHRRLTLRVLLESSGQAIVAVNADGKLVLANNMAYQMFGYGRGELIGAPLEILMPEDTRQRHRKFEGDFFAEASHRPMGRSLDVRGRRKDGTVFPIEVTLDHIETSGGTLAVAFVSDISERKQAEAALRQREEQYRSLFENMNEAVVYCEMVFENLQPFRIKFTNAGNKRGGEHAVEFRTIGIPDGKIRWIGTRAKVFFDDEGRAVRRVALVRDLTEQKQAEDKLRQSEERLRLAVESAGLGTIELDPYTGTRIWSDVAKAQFGLAPGAEIDETTFQKAVHPDDRERVQQSLEEAMRPGSSGEHKAEFRTIGIQDGKERWLSALGRIFLDSQGRVARRLGVIQDITERKLAEEAVRRSEERRRLADDTTLSESNSSGRPSARSST